MPPVERVPQNVLDDMDNINYVVNCDGMHDEDVNQNDQVDGHVPIANNRNCDRNINRNHNRPRPRNANRRSREEFQAKKMRPVWYWHEIRPGQFAYVKYVGFWHAVLVTGKDEARGVVKAIHFKWPSLLSSRVVSEDEFTVNLRKEDLWEVYVPEDQRRSPEEAVARARARLGQKGFNMFTNRSSHVVRECVVRS